MALLVFGFGDAQETLSTSPNGVDQKLEKLKETVHELVAISHRLHSATPDKLGLVSGLRAMCREFVVGRVSKSLFFPMTFQPILAPM